jgi:hypothetical protein
VVDSARQIWRVQQSQQSKHRDAIAWLFNAVVSRAPWLCFSTRLPCGMQTTNRVTCCVLLSLPWATSDPVRGRAYVLAWAISLLITGTISSTLALPRPDQVPTFRQISSGGLSATPVLLKPSVAEPFRPSTAFGLGGPCQHMINAVIVCVSILHSLARPLHTYPCVAPVGVEAEPVGPGRFAALTGLAIVFCATVAWSRLQAGASGLFEALSGALLGMVAGGLIWTDVAPAIPHALASLSRAIMAAVVSVGQALSGVVGLHFGQDAVEGGGEPMALEAVLPMALLAIATVAYPTPHRFTTAMPNTLASVAAATAVLVWTSRPAAGFTHALWGVDSPRRGWKGLPASYRGVRSVAPWLSSASLNRSVPTSLIVSPSGQAELSAAVDDAALQWGGLWPDQPLLDSARHSVWPAALQTAGEGEHMRVVVPLQPTHAAHEHWAARWPVVASQWKWDVADLHSAQDKDWTINLDIPVPSSSLAEVYHRIRHDTDLPPSISARACPPDAPCTSFRLSFIRDAHSKCVASVSLAHLTSCSATIVCTLILLAVGSAVQFAARWVFPLRRTRIRLFEPRYTPVLCRTLWLCRSYDDVAWSLTTWGGSTIASVSSAPEVKEALAQAEVRLFGGAPPKRHLWWRINQQVQHPSDDGEERSAFMPSDDVTFSVSHGFGVHLPRGVRIGQRLSDVGHIVTLAQSVFHRHSDAPGDDDTSSSDPKPPRTHIRRRRRAPRRPPPRATTVRSVGGPDEEMSDWSDDGLAGNDVEFSVELGKLLGVPTATDEINGPLQRTMHDLSVYRKARAKSLARLERAQASDESEAHTVSLASPGTDEPLASVLGRPAARAIAAAARDGLRYNLEVPQAVLIGVTLGTSAWTLCPGVLAMVGYW